MSRSCRKAACVDPRDHVARQQTASRRRSDQNSRRMFGRWVTEAVRPGIVLPGSDTCRGEDKWMEDCCRHAREAFRHAGRHEDALVAINRRRCLRRTARHVGCHLTRRCRRRHLVRHGLHRVVGRCPRHDRLGNRSQRKTSDHQDREQSAYGEVALHGRECLTNWRLRKVTAVDLP